MRDAPRLCISPHSASKEPRFAGLFANNPRTSAGTPRPLGPDTHCPKVVALREFEKH
jgi:hypothetical protein